MSDVPMTRPDLMLAMHEQDYGHSSSFVDLSDGRIMHFTGNNYRLSDDGGLTWGETVACVDKSGNRAGGSGCSVVKLDKGIGVAANIHPKPDDVLTGGLFFWRSLDEGVTWEEPIKIYVDWYFPHLLQNVAKRLSSGRIIIPVYSVMRQGARFDTLMKLYYPVVGGLLQTGQWVSTDAHFYDPSQGGCWLVYSDDDGLTWHRNYDGLLYPWGDWQVGVHPAFEPTVTEFAPGKLLMFMRTGLGRLYQSVSEDNGETWSVPTPTDLAADHSPAALATIPDTGHLICVWSQHNEEEIKQGKVRTRISSAISRSAGFVWEFFQNVESIYEETRVPPGPIRPCRPQEVYYKSMQQAMVWDPKHVKPMVSHYGRWSYPSLHITGDRALIANTYSLYNEDGERIAGSRLRMLPLEWFYGGRDRHQRNPYVDKIFGPARP